MAEVKVWKISHGDDSFDENIRDQLRANKYVTIGCKDKYQRRNFEKKIKEGDLFYLCYSGRVQLIGKFTSNDVYPCEEIKAGWVKRSYKELREADNNAEFKPVYVTIKGTEDGCKQKWLPSGTSTCYEVPQNEIYKDFEETILKPYFNITAEDLLGKKNPSTINNAFQKKRKVDVNLNTILYGPPGTGKTYHTAVYAVAICDNQNVEDLKLLAKDPEEYKNIYNRYNDLINEGRVKFTTFHQSYGYEDFIEGIKPETNSKNVIYDIKPGTFKDFCYKASFDFAWKQMIEALRNGGVNGFMRRTGNSINFKYINDSTVKPDINGANLIYKQDVYSSYCNTNYEDKSQLSDDNKKAEFEYHYAIIDKLNDTFDLSKNRVFIIDEINRGNISKIFGELITLIEDDKRGNATVTLPYSGESFTVPQNVYILGTMNTADRSIALMDTALRRRFTFVEMMPEPDLFTKEIAGVSIKKLLIAMNERIAYLYDREHTIGHAYFKQFINGEGTAKDLQRVFQNAIIPLLQEYFYDDYEKIALILADGKATDKFIKASGAPADWLGKQYDEGEKYDINPEIWGETVDFAARLRAIYDQTPNKQTEEESE